MNAITSPSLDRIWAQTLSLIKQNFHDNMQMFDSFFDTTKLVSLDGSIATVLTPSQVNAAILKSSSYLEMMETSLKKVTQTSYSFNIVDKNSYRDAKAEASAPQKRYHFFSRSRINPKLNFVNFVRGASNQEALKAALAAVEAPGVLNPIFIYSATGYGKTHLLNAIANGYLEKHPTSKVLYTDTNEFIDEFIDFSQGRYDSKDFREFFDTVNMLLIDDVQFLSNKTKTSEFFFNIFNAFVSSGKQIVITSDRAPAELDGLEDRLVSRFSSGLTIPIMRPQPDTMLSILKMKVKELGQERLLAPEVMDYLVSHNPGNIRGMEGDLNRVLFLATGTNADVVTLDMVEEMFAERRGKGTSEKDPLTPEKIIRAVAEYYQVAQAQIMSKMRTLQVATARKLSMYLCRSMLDMPYTEIGKLFGRDHSTVMSACSKISKELKQAPLMAQGVNNLKKKLSIKTVETAVKV